MAVALGTLTLGGCMSWQQASGRPGALLARRPSTMIRVVNHQGRNVVLYRPFISGDSLGGYRDTSRADSRVAMPLSDVVRVEVRRFDVGQTVLALAAAGATAALVVGALNSGPSGSPSPPTTTTTTAGCGIMGCGSFSCPLVYSWDGAHWRLDSGTFGGAIAAALQRTDVDNLDYARAEGDTLRLRVANELAETDHLDALAVLAVDHDPAVTVAPDPAGGLHTLGALIAPVSARDFRGADALPRVRDADGWSWESAPAGRDPGRPADLRDGLELVFVRPHGAARAHLVLDGNSSAWGTYLLGAFIAAHGRATEAWYDSLNAHPAAALAVQARLAREAFLTASVRTGQGWQDAGVFWEAGPEIVKRQVLVLDLSQVAGDSVTVRLASAPSFWTIDRVAMDFTGDAPLAVHDLPLLSAVDQAGRDVAPALRAVDHREDVLAHGDAAVVTFEVPPSPAGLARTWVLRSTGWYRVDTPETGEPDAVDLAALGRDSLAVGRASVARLVAALASLTEGSR